MNAFVCDFEIVSRENTLDRHDSQVTARYSRRVSGPQVLELALTQVYDAVIGMFAGFGLGRGDYKLS